ncbi:hypothetical protein [Arthrobacter sp. 754]|uniref:hypothetical protein n=1 Tax=Arthrobacter sp. 754 TaxID=3156315 RepID=UPI003390AC66
MALLMKNDVSTPMPLRFRTRSRFRYGELALAACGVATAFLILLDVGGAPLAVLKLLVCLVIPGWVALSRIPALDPASRLVCIVAVSAVVYATVAVVLAWTESWHPRPVAAILVLAASVAIVSLAPSDGWDPGAPSRRYKLPRQIRAYVPWLILAVAVPLWIAGLGTTSDRKLDGFGLLRAFPPIWYAAVALTVGLCIWGVAARKQFSNRLMSVSVTALVLMLYSSASLLASVPRLPWTYKHIAVTDYIGTFGHVTPSVDIYNRWPGFFSLSAFLGEVMGYKDALDYAGWAETGFALVDTVIVLAIARSISKNSRVWWTATLVFVLANYVNQNYYAPQAFSYSLYLIMCLIALTFLRGTPAKWVAVFEDRLRDRPMVARLRARTAPALAEKWEQPALKFQILAVAAIVMIQIVIVVSHQLTPYLAVLALCPLFLLGYFRPRWLGPSLLVIALIYLIPNVAYIRSKYGLFSGWNFFKNTGYKAGPAEPLIFGEWTLTGQTLAHGAVVLTAITGLLAIAGFVRRMLHGEIRTTLVVAWLAFAPILGLLGQSYGGEARFRVYLFALPWLAVGVAWLFFSGPIRTTKAAVGATASLSVMALLFTLVYFQPEADYRVSKEDVVAGKWLDSRVQPGDSVFETNYFFPLLIGPNYPQYLQAGTVTSLADYLKDSAANISVESIKEYAQQVRDADRTYIVLSDGQRQRAIQRQLFEADLLPQLEKKLMKADDVENVFNNGAVRIYEIRKAD